MRDEGKKQTPIAVWLEGEHPWHSVYITCLICSHDWVAIFPDGATRLDCPACGYKNDLDVAL